MRTAALVVLSLAALAACGPSRRGPAFGTPREFTAKEQEGRVLFMRHCNQCHPGGSGGLGPSINNKPLPSFAMRTQIRQGVGSMPAFTDEMLADAEVDAILAYLNELQEEKD
ncbi:c-type cytochrome [Pyxidicoccus xibeiensis]|uniref:c-type cytochrome n=1 Tax=Pyxidicoccus xibeiensis TaxID=2906759 RepID=UPI0020A7D6A3|nr:cytochrome c [Pyxidicoccus xibeiensis]MCP3139762.1 cytochrome c [Pyxidicoccus xibeiensis]